MSINVQKNLFQYPFIFRRHWHHGNVLKSLVTITQQGDYFIPCAHKGRERIWRRRKK